MSMQLDDITLDTFKDAMRKAIDAGHISIAPLGMSGDTIILHGTKTEKVSRYQQVSVRLYCGNPELLITNNNGSFLFYGRYDIRLGVDKVAEEYFRIFTLLKPLITKYNDVETSLNISPDAHETIGFEIMRKAGYL